jgi:hypothetical protein
MAADVVSIVNLWASRGEARIQQAVLARIVAWQRFMERDGSRGLTAEEEVGLFGELVVFEALLQAGEAPVAVASGWTGPEGELHDFEIRNCCVEVKTTLSVSGFPARITGLAQLDTISRPSLLLFGIRVRETPAGMTILDLARTITRYIEADVDAVDVFARRLLSAGLLDRDAASYVRRFSVAEVRGHRVDGSFPRIVRGGVPAAVVDARYTIDLDAIPADAKTLSDALALLGPAP